LQFQILIQNHVRDFHLGQGGYDFIGVRKGEQSALLEMFALSTLGHHTKFGSSKSKSKALSSKWCEKE